eukprot:12979309-Alexandrium_andersonii.AAC.1
MTSKRGRRRGGNALPCFMGRRGCALAEPGGQGDPVDPHTQPEEAVVRARLTGRTALSASRN